MGSVCNYNFFVKYDPYSFCDFLTSILLFLELLFLIELVSSIHTINHFSVNLILLFFTAWHVTLLLSDIKRERIPKWDLLLIRVTQCLSPLCRLN